MKRGDLCILHHEDKRAIQSWDPGPPKIQETIKHPLGSLCMFIRHEEIRVDDGYKDFFVVLIGGRLRSVVPKNLKKRSQ